MPAFSSASAGCGRSPPAGLTCLHRFAVAGWPPRDVQAAADEALRARYWSVPARVEHPAAYLACLLRDVDPADRPRALEDAMRAQELAVRDWYTQTTLGRRFCPHDHPGGTSPIPSPTTSPVPTADAQPTARLMTDRPRGRQPADSGVTAFYT